MDVETITLICEVLKVIVPTAATIVASIKLLKQGKMHSAKQSILQMQMEDVIAWELLHKLPYNYSNIHYEYDKYKQSGGNSDIDVKMKEYEEWYQNINLKKVKNNDRKA